MTRANPFHLPSDHRAEEHPAEEFCAVAPSPQLRARMNERLGNLRGDGDLPVTLAGDPRLPGFNDGTILPPSAFRPGTPARDVRRAALDRSPLRGDVRVIVVLVDFTDKAFEVDTSRFEELFFSTGKVPTGSVTEYYKDVTGGLVTISGQVVGPFTMPQTLAWYANGNYGIGKPSGDPRANILAQDAVKAADPSVDLQPYDNDGNGYVDAFIVVHAGGGGEETGDPGDIWSHKWVLPEEYTADGGVKVYAYLTIPENAKLGVSAHELGHLLFGFPDLYDIDYSSEGIGNWCLMAGGSWNGGGDTPAHPSAWCKAQQGWVDVVQVSSDTDLQLPDVKTTKQVHRLWTDGTVGQEYFLLENRQQAGYDAELPGGGLLIWHVDESKESNEDENHYLVGLMQADGSRDMENNVNRGDGGDPYPGWMSNTEFTSTSSPASTGYSGQDSLVSVTGISDADGTVTATVSVHSTGTPPPPTGDLEQRLASLEARVAALEDAVSRGGDALSAIRQGAQGVRGGSQGGQHGGHHDGHRGYREKPGDVVNAGLSAAARAARELVNEVQQQWSPRRRT
jgi:immune inhibitor A